MVWGRIIVAEDSTVKNNFLIIAMIIICDQQLPNIVTIIVINIAQPIPTWELAPLQQQISKQLRRQTHTGYLLDFDKWICLQEINGICVWEHHYISLWKNTQDKDVNEGEE